MIPYLKYTKHKNILSTYVNTECKPNKTSSQGKELGLLADVSTENLLCMQQENITRHSSQNTCPGSLTPGGTIIIILL